MKCKNYHLIGSAVVLLLFGPVCVLASSSRPSFDCNEARTSIEKAICTDAELSDLDDRLGEVYKDMKRWAFIGEDSEKAAFKQEQREWIRQRNTECRGLSRQETRACLKPLYEKRVADLEGRMKKVRTGGHYELVKGRQFKVCRIYERYLNSFDPVRPMICERPYNPKVPEIKRPKWTQVPVEAHLDWVQQRFWTIASPIRHSWDTEENIIKKKGFMEQNIAKHRQLALEGKIEFYVSYINLDNHGGCDHVLRYHITPEGDGCEESNQYSQSGVISPENLFYIGEDGQLDKVKSRGLRFMYDVFVFDGRTFLDHWGTISTWSGGRGPSIYRPGKGGGGITIYEPHPNDTTDGTWTENVCEIGYREYGLKHESHKRQ